MLAISKYYWQQHELLQLQQKEEEKLSLLFLGTASAHVSAPVAIRPGGAHTTTTISIRSTSSSVTMMAITAGGRTLIEIGKMNNDDKDDEFGTANKTCGTQADNFQIDVSYLDEDYENGLLILRRANIDEDDYHQEQQQQQQQQIGIKTVSRKAIDSGHSSKKAHSHPLIHKAIVAVKNPILASVLIGNVASMIGLLPMGVSGFIPAVSLAVGMRMKSLISRRSVIAAAFKRGWKIRNKILKIIYKLYKHLPDYNTVDE